MAGKALNFETGLIEYTINGTAKVSFNPTDADFADRFYTTLTEMEAQQDEIRELAEKAGDGPREMLDFLKDRDAEMRATVDGLLGEGVSDALFPNMNCYAMAGGLPVWMNLFFAIADEMGEAMDEEQGKTDPRLAAHRKKYDEMVEKYKPKTPDRQSHK